MARGGRWRSGARTHTSIGSNWRSGMSLVFKPLGVVASGSLSLRKEEVLPGTDVSATTLIPDARAYCVIVSVVRLRVKEPTREISKHMAQPGLVPRTGTTAAESASLHTACDARKGRRQSQTFTRRRPFVLSLITQRRYHVVSLAQMVVIPVSSTAPPTWRWNKSAPL